jgi:hypothetical protein
MGASKTPNCTMDGSFRCLPPEGAMAKSLIRLGGFPLLYLLRLN